MIPNLVSGGPNFTRNAGKAAHVRATHKKRRADAMLRQEPENFRSGFAGTVVEGERQGGTRPAAPPDRGGEQSRRAGPDRISKASPRRAQSHAGYFRAHERPHHAFSSYNRLRWARIRTLQDSLTASSPMAKAASC